MPGSDTRTQHAWELLADYRAGSTALFASPTRTLLASGNQLPGGVLGRAGSLADHAGGRVDRALAALFEQYEAPVVLAAVPYDATQPSCVVVPDFVQVAGPLDETAPPRAVAPQAGNGAGNGSRNGRGHNGHGPAPSWQISPRPSRSGYARSVSRAVEQIGGGQLDKVVLARSLDLDGGVVDAATILGRLARRDPHGYTYALELPATASGSSRRIVGASPELLVARSGPSVIARPLAGSAARSADPIEDARRGAALLASAKDRAEHEFVVDGVSATLRPYCATLSSPAEPTLVRTATMWHLLSEVEGELLDPSTSSLTLALALHPTPAVCGTPTPTAQAAIRDLEDFDRGFYAGAVGWCDASGDGEWAITLRCAELRDDTIRLYAGAGIVTGSDPAEEVEETGAKFRTMLDAMGIEHDA